VIERYLPHRKPVLMLTRIVSDSETSLEAEAFLDQDFAFQHDDGVIFDAAWCELAAQAAAVFMGRSRGSGGMGFLTGIDDFEIMDTVRTPARVVTRVSVHRRFGNIYVFEARIVQQEGRLVAKGGLSFFVENSDDLSAE